MLGLQNNKSFITTYRHPIVREERLLLLVVSLLVLLLRKVGVVGHIRRVEHWRVVGHLVVRVRAVGPELRGDHVGRYRCLGLRERALEKWN